MITTGKNITCICFDGTKTIISYIQIYPKKTTRKAGKTQESKITRTNEKKEEKKLEKKFNLRFHI